MADQKTSLLVNQQVPEFVREEHPKFITFLEAYYEFLEQKQGSELNDLTTQAKNLRYLSDIDESLDEFESSFFNTYASLVPKDSEVSKEFLIKNLLPLYLSKGSESSFKLLFRMLFGEDVSISYPRNRVLRASDGKWNIFNVLRVLTPIKSVYTGNGSQKEFKLAQEVTSSEISVYIDGVYTTNFYIKKEIKKIVFNSAPANNSKIEILFNNFNTNLLVNRQIIGVESNASAIIEKITIKTIYGQNYFEFFINTKTLNGTFKNGEKITLYLIDNDGVTINFELNTVYDVNSITIVDGGSSYNVGDPVLVQGSATRQAIAVVNRVATGEIANLTVTHGGHGFQTGSIIEAVGISRNVFNAFVSATDTSGNVSANTVNVYSDVVTPFANTALNVADYGFPIFVNSNANTIIANTLSVLTLSNIGPILNAQISVTAALSNPQFQAFPPTVNSSDSNNIIYLDSLGIIAKVNINNGGFGYVANDVITFTNLPFDYMGRGANAIVSNVTAQGTITGIKILTGGYGYSKDNFPTVNVSSSNVQAYGANLSVTGILGDGEQLAAVLEDYALGQILSIKILDSGSGYKSIPAIDLTDFGDGLATARAVLGNSFVSLGGKWSTSDSIISSEDRRLQGLDYYVNFAYVLSSKVEFQKYKEIFKNLIHPAGFIEYSNYEIREIIDTPEEISTQITTSKGISGTVNVNSSIYVTGTNTKFLVSQTNGILTAGKQIAVNTEIRTVDAILSNTSLRVTSAFTITTNNEPLVVLT